MPRFVVLEHDHPSLHWDLLLEAGSVLRAWRLARPPVSGEVISAQANFDHRLFYLAYEGPVSGGRGTVKRWDAGDFSGPLDGNYFEIEIAGDKLRGVLTLQRMDKDTWSLHYRETPSGVST